jgi:hypothetical protein
MPSRRRYDAFNRTPLQNDPQQHQREATNRKCRIPCGGKRSPHSESAGRELSKSGLGSKFGPQTCEFTRTSGGGTTAGTPTCSRFRTSRIQFIENPPLALSGEPSRNPDNAFPARPLGRDTPGVTPPGGTPQRSRRWRRGAKISLAGVSRAGFGGPPGAPGAEPPAPPPGPPGPHS